MEFFVSIITVCVTLFLGVAGLLMNSFVQRKSNSIKVITQHRLDRLTETQQIVAVLLECSDPDYLATLGTEQEKRDVSSYDH